jgi:hypothetical protein
MPISTLGVRFVCFSSLYNFLMSSTSIVPHTSRLYETICKLRRQFSLTWDDFRYFAYQSHCRRRIPTHVCRQPWRQTPSVCRVADTFFSVSLRVNIMHIMSVKWKIKNHHYLHIHRCTHFSLQFSRFLSFCYFLRFFYIFFSTPTISLPFYVWWWWCCEKKK